MVLNQSVEFLPKFDVFDRLLLSAFFSHPSVAFPAVHPFLQPLKNILAVRIELDVAMPLQCLKTLKNGLQFHSIVGAVSLAATASQFFAGFHVPENKRPAAWTRIAAACAIGEQMNVARCGLLARQGRLLSLKRLK